MLNPSTTVGVLAFWALSSLPTASAALSWSTCTNDENGKQVCKRRIPRGARLAIAVCCLIVLLLLITLVIFICINRRKAKSEGQEYDVEASQLEGPPAIIATEYDPTSGPSRIYGSGPKTSDTRLPSPPQMTGPAMPVAAHPYESRPLDQTRTAPVTQTTFNGQQPYPFTYDSRNGSLAEPPRTAYVSNGFPRSMLAGGRLKDKLKERPSSASSLTFPSPSPSLR